MSGFLKIIDRLKIKDKGYDYVCMASKNDVFRLNDELMDLHGNRFVIKGFAMVRFLSGYYDSENLPIGILIEGLDTEEACGNYFVRSGSKVNFIFCSDPLNKRRVDEAFEKEYQSAKQSHLCALFSYEDLEDSILHLYGDPISGLTIYRGWMMKPELYDKFYYLLKDKDIILINDSDEYRKYHLLPGWYDDFKDNTPESIWTNNNSVDDVLKSAKKLEGACIVKDYVKSRKHEWYDACFIKDINDIKNATMIINNFVARQEDDLVGGIVVRKYEYLNPIGYHEKSGMPLSEEYRVFVYAGRVLCINDYWQQGKGCITDDENEWINSLVAKIKSNFVTMDIARKKDGSLVIMELGDGQVSGLQGLDEDRFYAEFNC